MEPEEKVKHKKRKGKKFASFDAARNMNAMLSGERVMDYHTLDTRKNPGRVMSKIIKSKDNPKSWYIKYVNITPAANINRPMEPIFNVAFSENGTTGVPKFIELDVEWKGFADTFMMDQISYSAMQQVRKALKSNLIYSDVQVKACIVNGLALLIYGKMLERDVHWNLFNGSSDFNFSEMYKQQNQVVNTYGIVPLYPRSELLDTNLPYTSTVYNKVVSLFNQVIKLPKNASEFCSHYFGSLFTLDKDGHNDQYLKINMHEIDWFLNNEGATPGTIDLSSISIDNYLALLNAYSKDFAVLLSDLEKCLGVNKIQLCRYDEYSYSFVFDKTLLQALVNGYTDDSAVHNDFVRLDKMEDVDDDLTQFLFLGGIQSSAVSKADVHAIRILDMVLKCNSDQNIKWPKLMDQYPFTNGSDQYVRINKPFGLSITTGMQIDDIIRVANSDQATATTLPLNTYPNAEPANSGNTGFVMSFGTTPSTKFPADNYVKVTDNVFRTLNYFGTMVYLGAVEFDNGADHCGRYYFAKALIDYDNIPLGGQDFTIGGLFTFEVKGTHNQIRNVEQSISRDPRSNVWFFDAIKTDVDGSMMNHLNQVFSITAQGVTINSYGSITPTTYPSSSALKIHAYKNLYDGDNYGAYLKVGALTTSLVWSCVVSDTHEYALINDQQAAPNGLLVLRDWVVATTLIYAATSVNMTNLGEGLPLYVTQVIDYHVPIYYTRKTAINVTVNGSSTYDNGQTSLPVLIKEDYIPYYYNRLDLIPVLYEMFVSLFSIDSVRRDR